MNTPATDISIPLLFGRYRVLERLGDGRLATIYRATDERLQRSVLLHLLRKDLIGNEQSRQRFVAEANASAQCSHPALLEVFDSGNVEDRPYMITEYVAGQPLRALGVVTLEQALLYIRQVAGAVAACEARGVQHPPISSNNVLLVDEGRVKLVENWMLAPDEVPLDLAHYRAPERTEGQPPTPASTVYALGILLYELITGTRPVSGSDPWSVSQAHLTTRVPPLSHVRPSLCAPTLERLVERALAREPERRFPDVASFSTALDALWRDLSGDTQRLPVPPSAPPRRKHDRADAQQRAPVSPRGPVVAPAPMPVPAPQPKPVAAPRIAPADEDNSLWPIDRATLRRQMLQRGVVGWGVILLLLGIVVFGSYIGASYLVDRLFAIELPRPAVPALELELPDWIPAVNSGEILVVNAPGLNIRDEPDLTQSTVIDVLPNSTRVRRLEGPTTVDGVPWVRVRAEIDGRTVEGWVSANFLVPLE